jgi:hypothetical protein
MPKPNPQPKKLPGKNRTEPMVLARSDVEAATGEPLSVANRPKKPSVKKK